jgi:hypothetical protein
MCTESLTAEFCNTIAPKADVVIFPDDFSSLSENGADVGFCCSVSKALEAIADSHREAG